LTLLLGLSLLGPPLAHAQGRIPPGSLATSTDMWRLDSACTTGALAACDTIGMHHWASHDQDQRKIAAGVWQKACTEGGVGACANLAMAYDDGEGVKRDRKRAYAMAREACDSGSAPGCVVVASMLSDGRGGTKDVAAGGEMMERACTMGDMVG